MTLPILLFCAAFLWHAGAIVAAATAAHAPSLFSAAVKWLVLRFKGECIGKCRPICRRTAAPNFKVGFNVNERAELSPTLLSE